MSDEEHNDYDGLTPLDWAEYEFSTIEYDYKIPADAARRIRDIFARLYRGE